MPTTRPTNRAAPPSSGVGSACTLRSDGSAIAPTRRDSDRNGGTDAAVAATDTAITIR